MLDRVLLNLNYNPCKMNFSSSNSPLSLSLPCLSLCLSTVSLGLSPCLAVSSQSPWCLSLSLGLSPCRWMSLLSFHGVCPYLCLPPVSGYLFSISIMSVPNSVGLSPVYGCLFSISMASVLWLSLLNLYRVCPYLCRSLPCLFSISVVSACPRHCRSLACLISISVVSVPTSLGLSPVSRALAINNIFIHVFSVLSEPEENLYENTSFTPTTSL